MDREMEKHCVALMILKVTGCSDEKATEAAQMVDRYYEGFNGSAPTRATAMTAEPVAWQRRLRKHVGDPWGDWHSCSPEQAEYANRNGHPADYQNALWAEARPVYATPPSSGNADAVRDGLEHARARFACLVDQFKESGDTISWAMCSVDHERVEKAIAALSSAPVAGEWQDISTAPKDGRKVWIYGGHRNVPCETEADGEWWRRMAAEGNTAVPTHWMEHKIPAPPSKSAPVFKAAQNIAESDPVVTPGCAGADTVSRNQRVAP